MPPKRLLEVATQIHKAAPVAKGPRRFQRAAAALAPLAAAFVFLVVWPAKRDQPHPGIGPDQVQEISARLPLDGPLVYEDYLPQKRGTRGSEITNDGKIAELPPGTDTRAPSSADDAWWIIADHLVANRLQDASLLVKESLRRFPRDARLHNLAAILAYKRDDLVTAESALRTAREIDASPEVLFNLARVVQERGQIAEASDLQAEMAQRFPNSQLARLARVPSGSVSDSLSP